MNRKDEKIFDVGLYFDEKKLMRNFCGKCDFL